MTMTETTDADAAAVVKMEPFHMDIHKWITQHAPQHDDYGQYHSYCTNKLRRLTKQKDAKKYLAHSNKFVTVKVASAGPGGAGGGSGKPKRHAYCSRNGDTFAAVYAARHGNDPSTSSLDAEAAETVTDDDGTTPAPTPPKGPAVPHVNILWHLLVNAERSWANANEVQKSKGKHQTVLKKLKRAKDWADQLKIMATTSSSSPHPASAGVHSDDVGTAATSLSVVQQPEVVDQMTMKEIEAYCAWTSANLAMEKTDYMTACQEFAKSMTLCYELSEMEVDDEPETQRLERQDLFVSRADQFLRPLFRYCQYELKQAGMTPVEEPKASVGNFEGASSESSPEDTITFRGAELVLDSKELRVLLLKLQSVEQEEDGHEHGKSGESQFLSSLSVLDDALEVVQSLQKGLAAVATSGPAVQAKVRQYALWKGYLEYTKTRKVMDHTERLLVSDGEDEMGHAERVHIYDALIQHAKSLLSLPRPQDDDVDEEDEFGLQAQANILRLRALKTYSMAFVYYENHKYANALALLEHSSQLRKRAEEEIAACDEEMPHAAEYLKQMEDLPLEGAMCAVRSAIALQQRQYARRMARAGADTSSTGQKPISTDRPLLLRLYDLDGGTPNAPIADLRPIPMPCKPVFYDLAYNFAMDPSDSADKVSSFIHEHTVQPEDEDEDYESTSKSSSGLFGWLTGKS